MMAAKQAAEAEQLRAHAEETARVEAETRAQAEAERLESEERERHREKERLKKDELRKQGKLLSRSEKERQERNRVKLEQLRQAGLLHVERDEEGAADRKKPVYGKKKRGVAAKTEQALGQDGEGSKADGVLDDWENALESEGEDGHAGGAREQEDGAVEEACEEPAAQQDVAKLSLHDGEELRSPICCILGHVDTGKTKLLDRIRQTNVQEGEAGGITQQIGATFFPVEAVREKTAHIDAAFDFCVPGLLVIDTPGHESFTNLRSRGSSLCNMAILVVDIMHGLEPQTLESIGLLRQRKTPFIVALNKIDRLYGWKPQPTLPVAAAIRAQSVSTQKEFRDRLQQATVAFSEQGLNAALFDENPDVRKFVSLVPTSAISGDGVGDMLLLIVQLTQQLMAKRLLYLDALQCTVLEVKVAEGLGTTIDVILSNGMLHEGSRVAVTGLNGAIVTTIRALLTPQPLRELRIKSQYVHHRAVRAAQGIKICAPDLEKAIAGGSLVVVEEGREAEARAKVQADLDQMLAAVDTSGRGVSVQASTLGSLEALLAFLRASKIPVAHINIGPVYKRDVVRASVMLEQNAKEYAVLLAFDVRVDREAEELAAELDVRIMTANIIYHLFDQFTAYMQAVVEDKKRAMAPSAVFPCVLRVVPGCVFNKRDPLIMGVDVVEGTLRMGTPLAAVTQQHGVVALGRVTSIELNHKPLQEVRRGGASVAIRVEAASWEPVRTYGRHFVETDLLMSRVTRQSIDVLKEGFREVMGKEDWALVVKLKKVFGIQ